MLHLPRRTSIVNMLLAVTIAVLAQPAHAQSPALPGHVVDIRVGEYFILAPDTIPAGLVTLRLTQTGDVVKPWPADTAKLRADVTYHFHMIWLVRLDSAKTHTDLFVAERDNLPHAWSTILGGPGFADAPASSNATMVVGPGTYALVCYVGSAREDRHRYHLLKGMIRPVVVVGTAEGAQIPTADLEIVHRGGSVSMPDTLRAGTVRILVRNEDERPTEFGIARLKPGYTLAQAAAWRARSLTEPPRLSVGGLVRIAPGRSLMTTIVLEPGDHSFGGKHVVVH